MSASHRISSKELRRSLNLLILSITFGMSFFVVINGAALTGFTRALGASDLVYGIIMAMPVIGGILQVFASYYLESTGKRKQLFLISGFIQRLAWIPAALIPLIVPPNNNSVRIWAVTVLITIASAAGSINGVAFLPWVGDLVPLEIRGRFFSRRTTIFTISGAITGILVGRLLDIFQGSFSGYAVIFVAAALLGTADIVCFFWIKDPPMKISEKKVPFFKLFAKPYGNKNYIRFILYVSLWNFGVNFAGPFFNVYMLEHLNMTFLLVFIFGQVISNLSTILFVRFWGIIVDRFGCKPVMAICSTIIILFPFLWCFATPKNYLIILFINFLAGICWPGFDMAATNLSIWLAPEENRSIYVANYTLITSSVGIALAYICGGAFMQFTGPILESMNLPFVAGQEFSKFHALFIMSGLIRLSALVFLFPRFNEDKAESSFKVLSSIFDSIKQKSGIIMK